MNSNTNDPTPAPDEQNPPISEPQATQWKEWEEELKKQLSTAYLRGVSTGAKSYLGMILEQCKKGRKARENPAKTLLAVEHLCTALLAPLERENHPPLSKSPSVETSIDHQTNQKTNSNSNIKGETLS